MRVISKKILREFWLKHADSEHQLKAWYHETLKVSILIDNYENENHPIDFPDPIEAIKFRMEQMNYSQSDLAKIVGSKGRASEILNKKRKLSLDLIRKINAGFNIPAEVLLRAY